MHHTLFCLLVWFVVISLSLLRSTVAGDSDIERCHPPPDSGAAHQDLTHLVDYGDVSGSPDIQVLLSNLRRQSTREGLASQIEKVSYPVVTNSTLVDVSRRLLDSAPGFDYAYFPQVVYTTNTAICKDRGGYTCDSCCNGACCEKVADVEGDADYNPPSVLNKTGGFNDISDTATLMIPIRIVLITTVGGSERLSAGDIDNQLSTMNQYFANSKFKFFAYSFQRFEDNALANNCATDDCYRYGTCTFFDYLPRFVTGATSALDVVNIFLCPSIKYLGEAQFPWASVESSPIHYVQMYYASWSNKGLGTTYAKGMTAVHEVGHYFGALHTFERDGVCDPDGDYVDDTVPCKTFASSRDACDIRRNSCGGGYEDLSNIMNYASDDCMQHLSVGQLFRMEQATIRYRQEFVRRHFVEVSCDAGNNLESCRCADGSNIATLCGVYAERLPITLFLPGSKRFNGDLYNPPDVPPAPQLQDPLASVGVIVALAIGVMISVVGIVGLISLCYCCWRGDRTIPRPARKPVEAWECCVPKPRASASMAAATRGVGRQLRDDTFSLHISTQDTHSQSPASRVALPPSARLRHMEEEDDEYSDASGGGEVYDDPSPRALARSAVEAPFDEEDAEDEEYAEEQQEEEHAEAEEEVEYGHDEEDYAAGEEEAPEVEERDEIPHEEGEEEYGLEEEAPEEVEEGAEPEDVAEEGEEEEVPPDQNDIVEDEEEDDLR